jgi:hypothetical protein
MQTSEQRTFELRESAGNLWIRSASAAPLSLEPIGPYNYEVLPDEESVGNAMYRELVAYSLEKDGDIVMILLGGRGAQAMYRIIEQLAATSEIDDLLGRLHVFTQDALAPMRMANGLSLSAISNACSVMRFSAR